MNSTVELRSKIGVVVPCYNVREKILDVLRGIPDVVQRIYVVDDACPQQSGQHVVESTMDARIVVITHASNQGVGGAMVSGYRAALSDGMDIVVKIDGDGQMDPGLLSKFIQPIIEQRADYAKGNRFFELESLRSMPTVRLIGNAVLSFVNKLSCGYWDVMDPTNGYIAIHAKVLKRIPLEKVSKRYFFESDMLFRLATLRAVVLDIPMDAVYGNEKSGLKITPVAFGFPPKYLKRMIKRLFYNYFLRDFNAGSIQFLLGFLLVLFGSYWGISHWLESAASGVAATSGTVMLAALPSLIGAHLLIAAVNFDIANVPRRCLHPMLA
ncbi:MAG: glycosyltransferase family 2 protein [Betaproteobacteria bacterium]|nr:glycosyltransferase family 2 protein [Betaproteobacteria bacterium]